MEEIEKLSNKKACEALKRGIGKLFDELELEHDMIKNIEKCDDKDKLFSYWSFLCEMKITRERMRIVDDLINICKEV